MDRQSSQLISALAFAALLSAPSLAATKPQAQAQVSRRGPAPQQTVWDSQFWKDMDPRVYRAFTPLDKKIFQTLALDQYSELLGGTQPAQIRLSTGESLASFIARDAAEPKELVFTALPPCRVIDTRLPGAGGKFAGGETRTYVLRGPTTDYTSQGGNAAGCGIPGLGGTTVQENVAKALALNVIVVAPTGAGDMRAWPANQPVPLASVINYTDISGFNIANGIIAPMCDEQSATPCASGDISFKADVAGGFLVADVTGYFHEESSDITSIIAGTGLSGGGSEGDVTLSIDTAFQLPQTCSDGQVAVWSSGASQWQCGSAGSGGGGGAGFGKGDLYENVQSKTIAEGDSATVTVACNDANDLPLEGTCRPVPPAGDVLVEGERTIDWTSTSAAAKFECTFASGAGDGDEHDDSLPAVHRDDPAHSGTHSVQARIVCIKVP